MSSFCQLSKTKKQKENNSNFKVFFYNLLFSVKSKTKFLRIKSEQYKYLGIVLERF